jgi:hypothetical protein
MPCGNESRLVPSLSLTLSIILLLQAKPIKEAYRSMDGSGETFVINPVCPLKASSSFKPQVLFTALYRLFFESI